MRDADYRDFAAMLDQVCAVLSKGHHKPDAQASALWFRALALYSIDQVRSALDAHVKDPDRGRFVPTPADIIAKLSQTGRPGADEAWAIALRARDETQDLRWTDDIAEAWGIAKAVLEHGDEIGARLAFRSAYERICVERTAVPPRWWVSIGTESTAVADATGEQLLRLPAPTLPEVCSKAPPHIRERLLEIAANFQANACAVDEGYRPNPDVARTAELKLVQRDRFDAYRREHPEHQA